MDKETEEVETAGSIITVEFYAHPASETGVEWIDIVSTTINGHSVELGDIVFDCVSNVVFNRAFPLAVISLPEQAGVSSYDI